MSTLFHPHVICVWRDILIGLGTGVRAFKPSCEPFQAVGEYTNHLHHVHHFEITISTSWWFTSPISPVISRSSRPWSTCIIHCSQLLTIWSSMPLNFLVITIESILFSLGFLSQNSLWKLSLNRGYKGIYIVGWEGMWKVIFCQTRCFGGLTLRPGLVASSSREQTAWLV